MGKCRQVIVDIAPVGELSFPTFEPSSATLAAS
jgi:hypothetical protein